MTTERRRDGTSVFATTAVTLAVIALVVTLAVAAGWIGDNGGDAVASADESQIVDLDDGAIADPTVDPRVVVAASAAAMAGVTSVEFELEREGAPIFIDEFESLALNRLIGQFTVPNRAQAELTITVDGDLPTKIGAVAIDEEVWISNPVTGDFETLPAGFDIDPSRFFDPEDGWRPLLAGLLDVELVGVADRGGERYHVRGTAPAAEVRNITVGLVTGQDVPVDLWIHPTTSLVTAAEFTTVFDAAESHWQLDLVDYGAAFSISPPENVRA